jgi:uncharacterized membrane protein
MAYRKAQKSSALATLLSAVASLALTAWIVQLIWNWVIADLAALGRITFWQSLGLLVLFNILSYPFRRK